MKVRTRTSRPITTKRTALRISSTSSQNRSRCSIVVGGHGEAAPVVADQAGRPPPWRSAPRVQGVGQRRAPDDQGQRQQDLDLVVVDRLEHPVGQQPDRQAEHGPADRLAEEEHGDVPEIELARPRRRPRSSPMNSTTPTPSLNSDSPAICTSSVFGAPICLSRPSTAIGSVGEMSAPKSRQSMNRRWKPSKGQDAPHQHAHDRGRKHDAHRRQDSDRPLLPGQVAQVDVQAPRRRGESRACRAAAPG